MNASGARRRLLRIHAAAMDAADPRRAVERALAVRGRTLRAGSARVSLGPGGRVLLIAVGKASLGMTRGALERAGPLVTAGVVVHPEGAKPGALRTLGVRFLPGSHPVPTRASLRAGRAIAACAAGARPGDVVLVLLSGGGSAMAEWPRTGLGIADLRRATRELQRAGADIHALNTVRRALSRLKGGGLARAAGRAAVLTLALSDVVGDKPEAIASGPTVPSPTGPRDAIAVLRRFGLERRLAWTVAALRRAAREGGSRRGRRPAPRSYAIVGSNRASAAAAARAA
ncbi:MAG TPA: glycerate-2-kinase family protein, partial [Acidobacteriota bacterium]|nr:glycerate-2-kinase family protein [Acidobacteriota bacterium]